MWLVLLNNWKAIAGALAAFVISYALHGCSVDRLEYQHKKALEAQVEASNKQCDKEKNVTSEVSRDYQEKLTGLNKQLADTKRLHVNKCVSVAKSTGGRNGTSSGGEHAGEHRIPAEHLLDYGALAEKHRLQLIACQSFVRKERE